MNGEKLETKGTLLEEKKWNTVYSNKKNKKIRDEITRLINNKLPEGFDDHYRILLKKKIFDLKSSMASRQVLC